MLGDSGTAGPFFLRSMRRGKDHDDLRQITTFCDCDDNLRQITTYCDNPDIPDSAKRAKNRVVEHKGLFSRRVVFYLYSLLSSLQLILLNKTAMAFSICLAPGEMPPMKKKPLRCRDWWLGRATRLSRAGGQDPRLRDPFGRIRQISISRWRVGRAPSESGNPGRGPLSRRETSCNGGCRAQLRPVHHRNLRNSNCVPRGQHQ